MAPPPPVCVTGASGFIASHLVAQLLERGHRVRGTVRRAADTRATEHLRALPGARERLELVDADLTTPGAFDAAVAGCMYVVHTASPYALDVKDPQRDLVDPAVEGTRSVLDSCRHVGTVRRAVVTSSMAAITDEPEDDLVLNEADWNTKSTLSRNPYYLSKALAEREAWTYVETRKPSFDLVTINPFLVVGPSLSPGLNVSNQIFVDLMRGKYPGILSLTWGFVDVRDVALAHVLAMENPKAHGRYLCAAHTASMRDVVATLRRLGYEGRLPTRSLDNTVGDRLVRVLSYFQPRGTGSYLRTHIGRRPRFDNGKIRRELGLEFRPLETTIRDTMADLARWGHLPR
jgi:dihydroflavonol-4-reductase